MSYPNEIDAIILKLGDGASSEVFTTLCGVENVTVAESAEINRRPRRDCDKPGKLPVSTVRVTSTSWTISGSGVTNVPQIATMRAVIGQHRNYQAVAIRYDGTDNGEVLGTFAGRAVMSSRSIASAPNEGTQEITLEGEGDLLWTPAA